MARCAPILLTRPDASSRAFAGALKREAGPELEGDLNIVISQLIAIEYLPLTTGNIDGAIPVFTSAHGVSSWNKSALNARGPAICVGPATTKAAQTLGFDAVDAGGTVEEVFTHITTCARQDHIVHIHGTHTRGDLVARLRKRGVTARGVTAYDQPMQPLSAKATALLGGETRVIVPLFSPRTAVQFAQVCPKGADVQVIAMSEAVAEATSDLPGSAVIAARPDGPAMIAAVLACL